MKRFLRRFRWWILAAIIAAAGVAVWKTRKPKEEGPPVRTAAVERGDIVVSVSAVGTTEPLTTVDVKANVAGEITEMAVDRGSVVKAGDLIARIDPTETQTAFDQAQASVAASQATVKQREAELARQRRTTGAQVSAARDTVRTADTKIEQAGSNLSYQQAQTAANIRQAEEALETARARVRQAQEKAAAQPDITAATVRKAEQALAAAQHSLRLLTKATHPQERAKVKSQANAAKIAYENNKRALERLRTIYQRGGASLREVEAAESTLAASQDSYEAAQAALDTLDEKQSSEVEEAQAQVRQAQAGLDAALAGQADVRIAEEDLRVAQAGVREAEAALAAAKAGKAKDAVSLADIRVARASAQEARAQLTVAQANTLQAVSASHQVTQAQAEGRRSLAEMANARKNLGYTTVVAPRDGVVIDRFVEKGTVITSGRSAFTQGTSIVTLADISRMFVLADVDESDIGRVKVGQQAEVEVETFPGRKFPGRVLQVYPKGEEVENVVVFKVRVEIMRGAQQLRPGMTADVTIIQQQKRDALKVPAEAVFEQDGKSYVEVQVGEEKRQVEVKTGLSNFDSVEIVEGLKEGDQVILEARQGTGGMGGPGGPGGRGGPSPQMRMQGMMRGMGGGRR